VKALGIEMYPVADDAPQFPSRPVKALGIEIPPISNLGISVCTSRPVKALGIEICKKGELHEKDWSRPVKALGIEIHNLQKP